MPFVEGGALSLNSQRHAAISQWNSCAKQQINQSFINVNHLPNNLSSKEYFPYIGHKSDFEKLKNAILYAEKCGNRPAERVHGINECKIRYWRKRKHLLFQNKS